MILLDTETENAIDTESGRVFYGIGDRDLGMRKWPPIGLLDTGLLESWGMFTGVPAKDLSDLMKKHNMHSIYVDQYYSKKAGEKIPEINYLRSDTYRMLAVKRLEVMRILWTSKIKERIANEPTVKDLFEAYNHAFKEVLDPRIYELPHLSEHLTQYYAPLEEAMKVKLKETGKIVNKFGRMLTNTGVVTDIVKWQINTNTKDCLIMTAWYLDNLLFPNGGSASINVNQIHVNLGSKKNDSEYLESLESFLKNPFDKFKTMLQLLVVRL